jgi:hypothetical protein
MPLSQASATSSTGEDRDHGVGFHRKVSRDARVSLAAAYIEPSTTTTTSALYKEASIDPQVSSSLINQRYQRPAFESDPAPFPSLTAEEEVRLARRPVHEKPGAYTSSEPIYL